jgi:hypothetical protein
MTDQDYAPIFLDGGDDPTFAQIDAYLRTHFNARAIYLSEEKEPSIVGIPSPDGKYEWDGSEWKRRDRLTLQDIQNIIDEAQS